MSVTSFHVGQNLLLVPQHLRGLARRAYNRRHDMAEVEALIDQMIRRNHPVEIRKIILDFLEAVQ